MKKRNQARRAVVAIAIVTSARLGAQQNARINGWVVSDATLPAGTSPSADAVALASGIAYYPDANFRDGIIEFDLSSPGTAFAGLAFRMQSAASYEIIYFRPDGGRWASVQYQPVFEGETTWQLYHGDGYEAALPRTATGPLHVKILVKGSRADVYVGADSIPALRVRELKRAAVDGGIGFWVAGGQRAGAPNASLSKLAVTSTSKLRLADVERETHPPEQLLKWRVSPREASPDSIGAPRTLPPTAADSRSWKVVDAEPSGLINLTRAIGNPAGPQRVNVFGGAGWGVAYARVTITSARAETRRLYLSYSDGIGIYLNGARVFAGRNDNDSRGPGYLGVVGPETEYVDLALNAGDNDVLLAVTDKAFGWGFRARLDRLDGVAVSATRGSAALNSVRY